MKTYLTPDFFVGETDLCRWLVRVGLCLEKWFWFGLGLAFIGTGFGVFTAKFTGVDLLGVHNSEESAFRGSIGEYFSFVVNFGFSDNGARY